jgi:hypothetical protein
MLSLAGLSPGQLAIRSLAVLSDGEHLGMLTLRFYLDESGDSADPAEKMIGVAGCIAPLGAWLAFEPAWKAVLDEYGIKSSRLSAIMNSSGEFRDWADSKRNEFLQRLMSVLEEHVTPHGGYVGVVMPLEQARNVPKLFDLYYASLMWCLTNAAATMRGLPADERMEVILDKRPGYGEWRDGFLDVAEQDPRIGPRLGPIITNADYAMVRPLQAADLVAYCLTLHLKNILHRNREPHWLMQRLLAQRLHHFLFFRHLLFGPPEVIDSSWPIGRDV